MPWGRLDDSLYDHEKILAISNDALALWTVGLAFCNRKLTDGHLTAIQAAYLLRLRTCPATAIDELVANKLWEITPDGYVMHHYLDYNDGKATILTRRAERAEAGRLGGLKSAETRRHHAQEAQTKQQLEVVLEVSSKQSLKLNGSSGQATSNPVPGNPVTRKPGNPETKTLVADATPVRLNSPSQLLWDALKDALGYAPMPGNDKERGSWNAAIKTLLAAEETPESAGSLVAAYRARWPGIDCTPSALASKQALIRSARVDVVPPNRLTGRAVDAQASTGKVDYRLSPEQVALNARNNERALRERAAIAARKEQEKDHALPLPFAPEPPADRPDRGGARLGGLADDAAHRAALS